MGPGHLSSSPHLHGERFADRAVFPASPFSTFYHAGQTVLLKSRCERGDALPPLLLPGMVWISVGDGSNTLANVIHREGQHKVGLHLAGFEGRVLRGRSLWVRPGCTAKCGPKGVNPVGTIPESHSPRGLLVREALLRTDMAGFHVIVHLETSKKYFIFGKMH